MTNRFIAAPLQNNLSLILISSKSSVVCGQLQKPQMINSIRFFVVLEVAAKLSGKKRGT